MSSKLALRDNTASASASSSKTKHKKLPQQVRPALSVREQVEKRWKSISDQINDGYPRHALHNLKKILVIQPENDAALQTHIQLQLSLDRYRAALSFISKTPERQTRFALEQCYALYKLGRTTEAAQALSSLQADEMATDGDNTTQRAIEILNAQIQYRLHNYKEAQQIYEDLLATVDPDSPEQADLTANLAACESHLEFLASIPSRLGDLASGTYGKALSVEALEETPIAAILASHPKFKRKSARHAVTSNANTTMDSNPTQKNPVKTKAKTAPSKLPSAVAALPPNERPAPDPERWLPKRERKGYAEAMAFKEKEKEKRRLKARKKLEAVITQGSAAAEDSRPTSAAGLQAHAKSMNKSKSKKKSGK